MKRLTELAMLVYPAEWRRRYGVELRCLLEDSSRQNASGVRDVLDILRGGLVMCYTGTNMFRMAVTWGLTCGLLGLLISGVVAWSMPDRYRGETTLVALVRGPQGEPALRPASQPELSALVSHTLTDERLARWIAAYGLYDFQVMTDHPYQPGQDPAQDAAMPARLAQFRQDMKVLGALQTATRGPIALRLVYNSSNAPLAAQVANQAASALVEQNLKDARDAAASESLRIVITSPARIPEKPYRPNRLLILAWGLAGGAFIGITIALFHRRPMQLAG